ncbi:DUF7701 domain-containing protein [Kribbella jiaozuonensis]|uniref:DUF7701 domain-containing protein n=1 Tax=Kribbella jiaozuonensis TaxID=2575441 RepID=A0A4U3LEY7_9ACTN|nr:hypothetical protein [Kribbella jiaozuonensis]TKK74078.1 hypothetical protein FDA38_35290 [Kribbella jiaozuonensis]
MNYIDRLAEGIRSKIPSKRLPDEDASDLFRMYAVLLLAKGVSVTASDVHNAWVAWMLETDDSHESLVPYEDLAPSVAAQDEPYVEAIKATAREQGKDDGDAVELR